MIRQTWLSLTMGLQGRASRLDLCVGLRKGLIFTRLCSLNFFHHYVYLFSLKERLNFYIQKKVLFLDTELRYPSTTLIPIIECFLCVILCADDLCTSSGFLQSQKVGIVISIIQMFLKTCIKSQR